MVRIEALRKGDVWCRGRMRRSSVGGWLSLSGRVVLWSRVAAEIGVSEATVYWWRAQDRIDRGERPGLSSVERSELAQARRRIRELETELEITKKASALFASGEVPPKASTR